MYDLTGLRTTESTSSRLVSSSRRQRKLKSNGRLPQFRVTDRYWEVVRHLPEGCKVPSSLVKIGAITEDIYAPMCSIVLESSSDQISKTPKVNLEPKTLSEFRRFMMQLLEDDMSESEKCDIGQLINTSGLGIYPLDSDGFAQSDDTVPYRGIRIKMLHDEIFDKREIMTETQNHGGKIIDKVTAPEHSKLKKSILSDVNLEQPK